MLYHLSQHELAKRWRLSPRTLERWRWTGEGPSFLKIGGRVAYRLEDVEAWEAERLRSSSGARDRQGLPLKQLHARTASAQDR